MLRRLSEIGEMPNKKRPFSVGKRPLLFCVLFHHFQQWFYFVAQPGKCTAHAVSGEEQNQYLYYLENHAYDQKAACHNHEWACYPPPKIVLILFRLVAAWISHFTQKKSVGVNVGVKLFARERDRIELLRLDGTLTAARIAETYSISTRQAERLLTSLKKKDSSCAKVRIKTGIGL